MSTARVFMSLRFTEALEEGKQLQAALEAAGVSTFLCSLHAGDNLSEEISRQICGAELVVVMGSRSYGLKTASSYSTNQELQFIMNEQRPYFLVKMCDRFEEDLARFYLTSAVAYLEWRAGTPMPGELVKRILTKLQTVTPSTKLAGGVGASTPAPAPAKKATCPREHVLRPYRTPNGYCDVCAQTCQRNEMVLDCRVCNWFMCRRCAARRGLSVTERQEPITTCSRHHALEPLRAPGTDLCEVCYRVVRVGETTLHCHPCNWDMCAECSASNGQAVAAADPITTCPRKHGLKPYRTAGGRCDVCARDCRAGELVSDCRLCNWYMCQQCITRYG